MTPAPTTEIIAAIGDEIARFVQLLADHPAETSAVLGLFALVTICVRARDAVFPFLLSCLERRQLTEMMRREMRWNEQLGRLIAGLSNPRLSEAARRRRSIEIEGKRQRLHALSSRIDSQLRLPDAIVPALAHIDAQLSNRGPKTLRRLNK